MKKIYFEELNKDKEFLITTEFARYDHYEAYCKECGMSFKVNSAWERFKHRIICWYRNRG